MESNVRLAAKQVLTFIEKKASETGNKLDSEMLSFINGMKDVRWDQAYEKTMLYRIVPDQMRASLIKDRLSFLTDTEVTKVKSYLDFISDFAGKN